MWEWQITEYEAGRQLLDALALRIPAAPRGYLQQLIRKGRICSNGRPLGEEAVACGMQIQLPDSSRLADLCAVCGIHPASLLYEDRLAMVVAKPAGLAVHQAAGHDDNLADRLALFVAQRHAPYRTAPVHRLDIGTSGPVLFGKGRHATGLLGQMLMDGRFHKHYLAVVAGTAPLRGELTTPVPDNGVLKPALTHFHRLAANNRLSLLALDLVTGRPHQIRRQLADAGRPIIGDRRYGGEDCPGLDRFFLHCHRLSFPSPDTGKTIQVNCPLPDALSAFLTATGLGVVPGEVIGEEKSDALAGTGYNGKADGGGCNE